MSLAAPSARHEKPLAERLRRQSQQHVQVFENAMARLEQPLLELAQKAAHCLASGHKLLFCGNGGSASDALHIAAEFVGRFEGERKGLAAIALTADSSALTAIGNDYGYERVFARQVEALGRKGDLLIGLSTSGTSRNVLAAFDAAHTLGMETVLLTGAKGEGSSAAGQVLAVPSPVTARIQEVHIFLLHLLVELVETTLELRHD
jgi:D-sedoheptulose 7-phosphate isomerase